MEKKIVKVTNTAKNDLELIIPFIRQYDEKAAEVYKDLFKKKFKNIGENLEGEDENIEQLAQELHRRAEQVRRNPIPSQNINGNDIADEMDISVMDLSELTTLKYALAGFTGFYIIYYIIKDDTVYILRILKNIAGY
jgi:plasmid stabilization system protein ParE